MDQRTCGNCGRTLPHAAGLSDACRRAVRAEQNSRHYRKHRAAILRKRAENPHADVRYLVKRDYDGVLPETHEGLDGSIEPIEDWIELNVEVRKLNTALRRARRNA